MNVKKLQRFKSKAFRDAFVNANIDQGVAYQVKALRESRGWDQKTLAKKIGLKSQSAIARMEDPSYGKLSIASLKRLGKAFDVGLLIKFVPYSRMLTETEDLSPSALAAKSFTEEEKEIESMVTSLTGYRIYNGSISGNLRKDGVNSIATPYSTSEIALETDRQESMYVQ